MAINVEKDKTFSIETMESFSNKLQKKTIESISDEDFLAEVKKRVEQEKPQKPDQSISDIVQSLNRNSRKIKTQVRFRNVGTVQKIGNGVATVSGLPNVSFDELITFPTGVEGMVLSLEQKRVDIMMLGTDEGIRGGDLVVSAEKRLKIPVGFQLLGRVVDSLGNPLDRDDSIEESEFRFFSRMAPNVIERAPVNEPLFTGTKTIDTLFPIGRGQRELILGDRQTGKTTLAVDAILSQKNTDVHCVYVAIGQKKSSTLAVIETLQNNHAMNNTTVVMSSSDDPPALRYLAPYSGMTIAEYFLDEGKHVLIVFDDLSKHADSYRELSLLLRRPPGREAYPGDIFYIHSKLLERACKLSPENGGGSITALPIATTQNGNIAAYITTNLISITDGQLVLDSDLFNQGQKPAIDIGRSVSRVGGAAQKPAMRELVGNLKLELSQFEEVAHFTQFGTEVDEATRRQIDKGRRILSALKQDPHNPYSYPMTIIVLYALNKGFMDHVPVNEIHSYITQLRGYISDLEINLHNSIGKEDNLTSNLRKDIDRALHTFEEHWKKQKGEIE